MKEINWSITLDDNVKYNYTCGGWHYYYNKVTGEQYVEKLDGTVYLIKQVHYKGDVKMDKERIKLIELNNILDFLLETRSKEEILKLIEETLDIIDLFKEG